MAHYENWDGVTAPAIPGGWNCPSQITTTTAGETAISSPNMIVFSKADGSYYPATYLTADSNGGDVTVQGSVLFDLTGPITARDVNFSVFARSNVSSLDYTTSTFYELRLAWTMSAEGLFLFAVVGGISTQIGYQSCAVTRGQWYQPLLICNGASICGALYNWTTSQWLGGSGSLQSGYAIPISVTDSSVTGAGYAGLACECGNSFNTIYGDDWTFSDYAPVLVPPASAFRPRRRPIEDRMISRLYG